MTLVNSYRVQIRGQTYEFPTRMVKVQDLKLDLNNPRFSHFVELRGKRLSREEVEEKMWEDQRTRDLYNSIKAHGGLQEPVWIKEDGTVVEGNRRAVVLKMLKEEADKGKLAEEGRGPGYFDEILCVVYPVETPRDVIRIQMGIWHIGQKKSWPAIAEAKFIHEETEKGRTIKEVAADLGRSVPYLLQKKWAYEQMRQFLKVHPSEENVSHFSYFEELYKQRDDLSKDNLVVRIIEKSSQGRGTRYRPVGSGIADLYQWILNNKFGSEGARGLRGFSETLSNPEAYRIFKKSGLQEARNFLAATEPVQTDENFVILGSALSVIRDLNRDGTVYKPGSKRYTVLRDLNTELQKILRASEKLKGS